MGTYINLGNEGFVSARNSEYVDKSELIAVINNTLNTEWRFSCVSRCRRFGKSMAAKMLNAYYDRSCDSRLLFSDLKIASDKTFEQHLNKYPVILLDMSDFVTRFKDERIILQLNKELMADVHKAYPQVSIEADDDLMALLIRIAESCGQQFIFIIDEWDAICREFNPETKAMDAYLDWLRRMFKGGKTLQVFAGVYMTGILPIKKYNTQSALNNFMEYSMVKPGILAGYFGFTKDEVKALARKHDIDFDELTKWYDGYQLGDQTSIFNPNSVMTALYNNYCESYWGSTGTFDAVTSYIQMNFDGLKDDIICMLAGGHCKVNPTKFQNDISIVRNRDDVLTVLIHLGYLSYNRREQTCYIPNREIAGEMENAVEACNWHPVTEALNKSEQLLQATLRGNEDAVAQGIEAVHDESTSILSYNDENSLSCVLSIAYYAAKNDYIMHRELASGKGFADIVLIPRKAVDLPAIVLELKVDKDADTAISQILRKNYPAKVAEYTNHILLVGISYDRTTKKHTCKIQEL